MTATLAGPLGSVATIEFVDALPGFPEDRQFAFTSLEETGVLWALESITSPGLRFVAAVPEAFFPDYSPVVDSATVAGLTEDTSELVLLVILTVSGSIVTATANLLAPLIVAPSTGRALQVVLGDDPIDLRAPLRPALGSNLTP
jgi:flagellar assembly factor FliW